MITRCAPQARRHSSAPAVTSAAYSRMSLSSQVMYGSHSAPFMRSVSTLPRTFSFTAVGNPAPPMPTMPASAMRASTLSGVRSASGASVVCSSEKSFSMRTCSVFFPAKVMCVTMLFTVPATGENTFAESPSAALPISCPRKTRSPACTAGTAGAPICWESGTQTSFGSGSRPISFSLLYCLHPAGCTPPPNRAKRTSAIHPRRMQRRHSVLRILYHILRAL